MKMKFTGNGRSRKQFALVCSAALLLSAGIGYYLGFSRGYCAGCNMEMAAPQGFGSESLSEVENAKRTLQALSRRCVAEAAPQGSAKANTLAGQKSLKGAIERLEEGRQEFRGAEPELVVAEGLLKTLKNAGQSNRWMAVYLDVLYRHPTSDLVGRLAKEAAQMSSATGRQDDLAAAFMHVCGIPIEFDGKQHVEFALAQLGRENQLGLNGDRAARTNTIREHAGG